jgi:hypothetical protein
MSTAPNGLNYWSPTDLRATAEVIEIAGRRVAIWMMPHGMRGKTCWEAEDVATNSADGAWAGVVLCFGETTRARCIETARQAIVQWPQRYTIWMGVRGHAITGRVGPHGQLEMVL